jgi:hypothetical protein
MADDLDVNHLARLLAVAPDAGMVQGRRGRPYHLNEPVYFLVRADVEDVHPEELLLGEAVVGDGGIVHRKEPIGNQVEDPHGQRVGLEHGAEGAFTLTEGFFGLHTRCDIATYPLNSDQVTHGVVPWGAALL